MSTVTETHEAYCAWYHKKEQHRHRAVAHVAHKDVWPWTRRCQGNGHVEARDSWEVGTNRASSSSMLPREGHPLTQQEKAKV